MTQVKSHSKIYFVTTLSIYVGLVLIGASPQILAQAKISNQTASQSIELSSRTDSAFAKIKHRQKADRGDILPFSFAGGTRFTPEIREVTGLSSERKILVDEIPAGNQKILTTNLFPRASIRK